MFDTNTSPAKAAPASGEAILARDEAGAGVRLAVRGFTEMERRLLQGSVMLSQRRAPRLELVAEHDAERADVVMIDAHDPSAVSWASHRTWLAGKPVIWVDSGMPARSGHVKLDRPVQWPILPMLLFRAIEQAGASKQGSAQHAAAPERAVAPRGASRRILVVDDSLAVRAHLRTLLEPRGFRIVEADTGESAIDTVGQEPFGIVLMDVLMPGIDGFEACRRIKARGRAGSSPAVVMLTSKSSPFNRVRGKMAGCDAYLTKPIAAQELFTTLEHLLGGPLPARETLPLPSLARP